MSRRVCVVTAIVLLLVAGSHHNRYYQAFVKQPNMTGHAWQALHWAAQNLNPREHFVANLYGSAGAYLPGLSGLAVTEFHAHIADQVEALQDMVAARPVTHVLYIERDALACDRARRRYDKVAHRWRTLIERRAGDVIYRNGPVRIHQLGPRLADRPPPSSP